MRTEQVQYFLETVKHLIILGIVLSVIMPFSGLILKNITIFNFLLVAVVIVVVYNVLFLLVYFRTNEMKYLLGILKGKLNICIKKSPMV